MSAAGRSGASIFAQGPAPAGSARGAPIPANEDQRRRFPTWSLCPQLRLHEGQATTTTPSGPAPSLPPRRGPRTSGPRRVPGAPQSRPGRGPSPSWPPANSPAGLPARREPGARSVSEGAAPLFVERRVWDLLPRRRPRPAFPAPAGHSRSPGRRLPPHRTSSRRRRRRVPSPPPPPLPPHHVPHPGLRHRVKRSRPAWVGAQRPARARRPRDQSAALRPGRDTTLSRPLGRRAPRPGASFRGPGCATRGDYGRPRAFLNRRASAKPPPAASGKSGG